MLFRSGVDPGKRFLHRRHPVWDSLAGEGGDRDEEAVLFQTREKHEAGISSVVVTAAPEGRKFVENGLCEYFGFSMFSCPPASN